MNVPPELRNPLLALGLHAFMGQLGTGDAIEHARTDPELTGMSDEQLRATLEDADAYWRGELDTTPGIGVVYARLVAEAAQARAQTIGAFRRGVGRSPELDRRFATWLDTTAWALLEQAMALLVVGAGRQAWETFVQGWTAARALPDSGQLRLRETLWGCMGRREAAQLEGADDEEAADELQQLLAAPGREAEAERYRQDLRREFERIAVARRVFRTQLEAQQGGGDG